MMRLQLNRLRATHRGRERAAQTNLEHFGDRAQKPQPVQTQGILGYQAQRTQPLTRD